MSNINSSNNKITYRQVGDYLIPNLIFSTEAEEMFSRLVNEMALSEGITEELKATDQMAWVGAMNNIRQRATEIVNSELVYT